MTIQRIAKLNFLSISRYHWFDAIYMLVICRYIFICKRYRIDR